METSPVTCHTHEEYYHINGRTFGKQYKEVLSGFRSWEQPGHADEWLLFPDNIGPRLAIDESPLSNGELYTFVTNRDAGTRECSLVAVVAGTKSEDVTDVLQRIDEEQRYAVKEVTLDLSYSMRKIVRTAFPKADRVIDRFHVRKLSCDAVQELRIEHRWVPYGRQVARWRRRNCAARTMSRIGMRMATPARNCLYAHAACLSNPLANGLADRNLGRKYYSMNIPTSGRHTVCATR